MQVHINCYHMPKEIIAVCMDKDCKSKRTCCQICIKEFHNGHNDQLIKVEKMIEFLQCQSQVVQENKEDKGYHKYNGLYVQNSQLKEQLKYLIELIDDLRKKVQKQLNKLRSQKLNDIIYLMQQAIEYWNEKIDDLIRYVKVENGQLTLKTQQDIVENDSQFIDFIKVTQNTILKIIPSFNCENLLKPFKLQIDPELIDQDHALKSIDIPHNGQIIVSISDNEMIKLWNTHTRQLLLTIKGQEAILSQNYKYMALRLDSNTMHIYKLTQQKQLLWRLKTNQQIGCYVFSQDSQFLLTYKNQGLAIWNVMNRKQINFFQTGDILLSISMSPDNNRVICISTSFIYLFDFQSKIKLLCQSRQNQNVCEEYFCHSADILTLVTSGVDNYIRIYKFDNSEYTVVMKIKALNIMRITEVKLSLNELYTMSVYDCTQILIHEIKSGRLIRAIEVIDKFQYKNFLKQNKYISISFNVKRYESNSFPHLHVKFNFFSDK